MTYLGKLPTYMNMEEALSEYFFSGVYVDFPISCRCGEFEADTFAGIAIHLRKAHGIYLKKDKGVHKEWKKLFKKMPITFKTKRSLKNDPRNVSKYSLLASNSNGH